MKTDGPQPRGGAAVGHPGTEYMDVLGTQESMDSGGYPPEPMNPQGIPWFWGGPRRINEFLGDDKTILIFPAAERTLAVFKEFPGSQRRKMTLIRTSARSAAPRRGRQRKAKFIGSGGYPPESMDSWVPSTSMYSVPGCPPAAPPAAASHRFS